MKSRLVLGVAAAALFTLPVSAIAGAPRAESAAKEAPEASKVELAPIYGSWGVDPKHMDKAVKPGDDFFRFVNGTWEKTTTIAPDRSSAGVGLTLVDRAEADVRRIVEDMAANPALGGANGQKVGDYYAAWMDEGAAETRGAAPLKPYLARIDAVTNKAQLLELWAQPGWTGPVAIGILPDPAGPTRYIAAASQAGLGMPSRDYYIKEGAQFDTTRAAYRAMAVKLFTLAGFADAAARADRAIALETAIAKVQWAPERSRDIQQIYNPMDRAKMTALAPQWDWTRWLELQGLGKVDTVIVGETSAIADTGKMLDSVAVADWQDYSRLHLLITAAPYLSTAFDDAQFEFFGKTMRGQQVKRDRWKRGIQQINGNLGEAVGELYVKRHYPPESATQMAELIANLRAAMSSNIGESTWMDEATKKEAVVKLDAFDPRTGHPTKYIDYSSFAVRRDDPLGNHYRSADFQTKLALERLPKPVDRDLWGMNPQEVNAYYHPLMNQIVFPAAILQPPYFSPRNDPAVNYGGMGAIIGHEIGHGFDDQGRQFDAQGRIRDWWTKASADAYKAQADRLVAQFNQYEPVPGTKVNGQLTLGENLGDLGGLEMAWKAWQLYKAKHGEPPVLDGFTGDQRFFLAYAYSWQGKRREGALREQLLSDPHSPNEYRVNGIVRNFGPWYQAFGVKPGDKLYLKPEDRVRVWSN